MISPSLRAVASWLSGLPVLAVISQFLSLGQLPFPSGIKYTSIFLVNTARQTRHCRLYSSISFEVK
jgi:hypothetical protein